VFKSVNKYPDLREALMKAKDMEAVKATIKDFESAVQTNRPFVAPPPREKYWKQTNEESFETKLFGDSP